MKTNLGLLSLLLLPALLTSCPEKGGLGAASTLRVAVSQPETLADIPTLMDSLKTALSENQQASSSGLEVRVIVSENEIVTIPAPKLENVMVKLFGPSTPYAMEKKLEAHLVAVEERLKAGCPAEPVTLSALKALPQALYGEEDYVVWTLEGDARKLWSGTERGPKAVVSDAESLKSTLDAAATRNLLVLGSSVKTPVVIAAKKPVKKTPVAAKAKTVSAATTKQPASPASMPPATQGSTVVLNVGTSMRETSAPGKVQNQPEIGFDHAELAATFPHDTGKTEPKDKLQVIQDAERIKALQKHFEFEVVIIARADKEPGSTKDRNQELSEQRAHVIKALLIQCGIPVHDTIFIGDATAEGTSEMDRGTQIYLINKRPRIHRAGGETASR